MGNAASKSYSKPVTNDPKQETKPETLNPKVQSLTSPFPEEEAHNAGQPVQANLDPHGKQVRLGKRCITLQLRFI